MGKYIEYPFDTVKVRLQSQPEGQPLRYAGPLDCFRQSFKAEGVAGLYRGISAPLVGAALETSCLFFFERVGRGIAHQWGFAEPVAGGGAGGERLPLSALWLTGAFSGVFTSFVLTPIELVKCRIQVSTPAGPGTGPPVIHAPPRPVPVIRDIFRHEGLAGFWHGQMGTLIREAGGCAAWFGTKETVTDMFRGWNAGRAAASAAAAAAANPLNPAGVGPRGDDEAALPLWQQATAGASAGVAYNFLFFPADTVKSRMQTTPVGERRGQRRTFWGEGKALWRTAGLKGFYRGCGITVLRSAPSSAFIFMVYDGLKKHLRLEDMLVRR